MFKSHLGHVYYVCTYKVEKMSPLTAGILHVNLLLEYHADDLRP